jgi:uncharacterized membrane protein YkvA (DUF1232 family)
MKALARLQEAAHRIKRDAMTVYFFARDPPTPLLVRLLALAVAAYALSPIDLIPDFIPVLGYLDDLLLLPLGIFLIVKLTPAEILEAGRARAKEVSDRPRNNIAAVVIVVIWVLCIAILAWWLLSVIGTADSKSTKPG